MSRLLELQRKIHDTNALITQMERSAVGPSVSPSVFANIRSLEKRRAMLEKEIQKSGLPTKA